MNTWISDTQPLLSLIFPFLSTLDQQKWRLAGSLARTMSDVHFSPMSWKDIVLNQPNVCKCPICSRINLTVKMFYCSVCWKYICGTHVMTCNVCMYDLCATCALSKQCTMCQWPAFSIHYS